MARGRDPTWQGVDKRLTRRALHRFQNSPALGLSCRGAGKEAGLAPADASINQGRGASSGSRAAVHFRGRANTPCGGSSRSAVRYYWRLKPLLLLLLAAFSLCMSPYTSRASSMSRGFPVAGLTNGCRKKGTLRETLTTWSRLGSISPSLL